MTVPAQIEPQWGDGHIDYKMKTKGFKPVLLNLGTSQTEDKKKNPLVRVQVRTKVKKRTILKPVKSNKFIRSQKRASSKNFSSFQNMSVGSRREKIRNIKIKDSKIVNLIENLPVDRILRPEIISFVIAFFVFSILCGLEVPSKIGNRDASLKRMIALVSENELDQFSVAKGSSLADENLFGSPQMAAFSLEIPSGDTIKEGCGSDELKIKTYKIRKGDALSLIALMYGVKCESVASLNKISDIRKMKTGEDIGVPSEDGLLYRIEKKDNHSIIAEKLNLDSDSRTKFLIDYPKLLPEGTEIFVRGAQMDSHQKNRLTGDYFLYPLNGTLLTRFGETINKRTEVEAFSEGIELAASKGSIALASRGGTVIYSRQHPALGGCVMVEHKGGVVSVYGQLLERNVSVGDRVEQGDSLGLIGNSVFGKGPHLFFSIKKDGIPVDPLNYLY